MFDRAEERELQKTLEDLLTDENYTAALSVCERLLASGVSSFNLRSLYTRTLKALDRQDELEKNLLIMNQQHPENTMVLQELADLFFKQSRFGLAGEQYQKIAFLEPFNRKARDMVDKLEKYDSRKAPDRFEDTSVEIQVEQVFSLPKEEEKEANTSAAENETPVVELVEPDIPDTVEIPMNKAENPASSENESFFETESQAELYLAQGMPQEAASIYLRLYEKSSDNRFYELYQSLQVEPENKDKIQRRVAVLENLLQAFQNRGNHIVQ